MEALKASLATSDGKKEAEKEAGKAERSVKRKAAGGR